MFIIPWNPLRDNPWQSLWIAVWNISEMLHVDLGRIAPWVFQQYMGRKAERIDK